MKTEKIVLGGGCFWCLEPIYDAMRGVQSVESGYAGGHVLNPTYEQICDGNTGHAEVLHISFDADVVSLRTVLDVFFAMHDPTTLNRQGNDRGTQYRSVIYFQTPEQEATAHAAALAAQDLYDDKIVTEIAPLSNYSEAEAYHQEYYARNPNQGYCVFAVAPKVAKFRKTFAALMK
jgi:peptide-methionine (S)-S-oxide reductase